MKRAIVFIAICLIGQFTFANNYNIVSLRKLYNEAVIKKDSAEKFLILMDAVKNETTPILLCYKGMAKLMQSKYLINPYSKIESFNSGKNILEKAVNKEPDNIEIRFMRFSIQTNVPSFLNYNNNINEDKLIILNGWSKITDLDLKQKIKAYMLKSKVCTPNEKLKFA
jgi:hypothetical protein